MKGEEDLKSYRTTSKTMKKKTIEMKNPKLLASSNDENGREEIVRITEVGWSDIDGKDDKGQKTIRNKYQIATNKAADKQYLHTKKG